MGLENQAESFFVRDPDTGGVKKAKRESPAWIPPEKLQDLLMKIKEEEAKTARVRFQRKPESELQPKSSPTTERTEEEKRDIFKNEQDWLTESQKKRKSEENLLDGPTLVIKETLPMPTVTDEKPKERPKVWDHYEKDPNDQNKSVCVVYEV